MNFFKTALNVDVHDIDFNGIAKASAIMRYLQSAAQLQLTENGMSYDELKEKNKAFILSRIRVEFTGALRAHEPLAAITYPCKSRAYSFLRCYELLRDGKTMARAVSIWALVDTKEHSLVKVNDFDLGLETYDVPDIPFERIVMPKNLENVGTFSVSYGTVDRNRHMNNTSYADLYSSFLPIENKRIEYITIHYVNEAPLSEKLTVMLGKRDSIFYIRTLRQDGKVNTEAEIKLCDIEN